MNDRSDEPIDENDVVSEIAEEIVDDTALLSQALGGWRGMLDSGAPSLVFLLAYLISHHNLELSIKLAVISGALLAVERLLRRKSLQQVLSGGVGLAISAYITQRSGQAENFFLPGILWNLGYFVVCLLSIVIKKPVLGFMIAGLKGQDMSWTRDDSVYRAYSTVTLLWVGIFGLRVAIMLPLYIAGAVTALGTVKLVLGWPLYLLGIYASVRILKARQVS